MIRRMTKADRKVQALLRQKVERWILDQGGRAGETPMGILLMSYEWELYTKAGILGLCMHKDENYGHAVYCRFADVERAKQVLSEHDRQLNRCSGKWNFHWSLGDKPEDPEARAAEMFAQFKASLWPLLPADPADRAAFEADRKAKMDAMDAGREAGNAHMREHGREKWDDTDYDVANAVCKRLWPDPVTRPLTQKGT